MKQKRKSPYAARIQNAVYGFVIPMMSIPALYAAMEKACEAGKSDAELVALVAAYPGVYTS